MLKTVVILSYLSASYLLLLLGGSQQSDAFQTMPVVNRRSSSSSRTMTTIPPVYFSGSSSSERRLSSLKQQQQQQYNNDLSKPSTAIFAMTSNNNQEDGHQHHTNSGNRIIIMGKGGGLMMLPGIYGLILLQIVIFLADKFVLPGNFVKRYLYLYHGPRWFKMWQPLTCCFCHQPNNFNLLGHNLLLQWLIGRNVESQYGRKGLILGYSICGIISSLTSLWLLPKYTVSIGATGATLGMLILSKLPNLHNGQAFLEWRNLLEMILVGSFAWQQFVLEISTTAFGTKRRVPYLLGHLVGVALGAVVARGILPLLTSTSGSGTAFKKLPRFGGGRRRRQRYNQAATPTPTTPSQDHNIDTGNNIHHIMGNGWTPPPTSSRDYPPPPTSPAVAATPTGTTFPQESVPRPKNNDWSQRDDTRRTSRDGGGVAMDPNKEQNWWRATTNPIKATDLRGQPVDHITTDAPQTTITPTNMPAGPIVPQQQEVNPLSQPTTGFPEHHDERGGVVWDAKIRESVSRFHRPSSLRQQGNRRQQQHDLHTTSTADRFNGQSSEVSINQTGGIHHDMGLCGTRPTYFNGVEVKKKADPVKFRSRTYLNGHEVAASVNPNTGRINYGMDVDLDIKEEKQWWQRDALEGWEDKQ